MKGLKIFAFASSSKNGKTFRVRLGLPNQNGSGNGDDSENDSRNDSINDSMTLEDRNLSPRDLAILRSIQTRPGNGARKAFETRVPSCKGRERRG